MIRILLADDHAVLRAGMRRLLSDVPDLEVVLEVGSGFDAVEGVRSQSIDVALVDVTMPGPSGYDVCQKIRENPAWAAIRIVMLSAKGRDIEVTKGIAVGADAYVTKPFSTKDLIAKVQELLGE